jgi:site-specific recombinase XerD
LDSPLQAFVVHLRERGVKPVSCNTYLKTMNSFCRWLHAEGHAPNLVRLAPLKAEKALVRTFADPQMRSLLSFRPQTFNQWRTFALACALLDSGCRADGLLSLRKDAADLDSCSATCGSSRPLASAASSCSPRGQGGSGASATRSGATTSC